MATGELFPRHRLLEAGKSTARSLALQCFVLSISGTFLGQHSLDPKMKESWNESRAVGSLDAVARRTRLVQAMTLKDYVATPASSEKSLATVLDDPPADNRESAQPLLVRLSLGYHSAIPWVVFGNSILLLGLLGILIYGRIRSRRERGRRREFPPGPSARRTELSVASELTAIRLQSRNCEEHALAIGRSVQDDKRYLLSRIDSLSSALTQLQTIVTAFGSDAQQQIDQILGAIGEVDRRDQDRNAGIPDVHSASGTAVALAAVVNEWILRGGRDRPALLRLAQEAGLTDLRLASFADPNQVSGGSDTQNHVFCFDGDGSWLWAPVPGTSDFWCAPADAAAFRMGAAPQLLEQLFDGLDGVQPGFRFAAVYHPCRLRSVGSTTSMFGLVERGMLQLDGSPAPTRSRPISFSAVVQAQMRGTTWASPGRHLGGPMAAWVRKVAAQLGDHSRDLGQLQEEITRPPATTPTTQIDESSLHRLEKRIDGLSRQNHEIEERISEAMAQLRSFAARTAVEQTTSPRLVVDAPTITNTVQPPARSYETRRDTLSPNPTIPAIVVQPPRNNLGELLPVWLRAFRLAATLPQTEPQIKEVPPAALYVQRARTLSEQLKAADPDTNFAVVHLKRVDTGYLVEVHPTVAEPSHPEEARCLVCNVVHNWQLAVCAGILGGDEIFVFLPASTLGKSIYSSGYSVLIEDPPPSFSTYGVTEPAQLRRSTGSSGEYSVVRKLVVTNAAASEAGRRNP